MTSILVTVCTRFGYATVDLTQLSNGHVQESIMIQSDLKEVKTKEQADIVSKCMDEAIDKLTNKYQNCLTKIVRV
jgi:hypothetical protein